MVNQDLTNVGSHFAFGENWASYAQIVSEDQIEKATAALHKLLGGGRLQGKRFLDIGCGSGIHTLAALRLGASKVVAVDLDSKSIAATRSLLARYVLEARCCVEQLSVFDLSPDTLGRFDVVYSWGVLHHTGHMDLALRKAAAMVGEEGEFLFALYRRTWLCPFWRAEKKWYSQATPRKQRIAQRVYVRWFEFVCKRFFDVEKYVREYGDVRGMDFCHDVHDWLGGYPYESILPDEVDSLMGKLGLRHKLSFLCRAKRTKMHGLLGSGCDEYAYVRTSS